MISCINLVVVICGMMLKLGTTSLINLGSNSREFDLFSEKKQENI